MNSLQGHMLIATPELVDPNFFRSVVLIVQHSEEGALGLIINRPTETPLAEIWPQLSDEPCEADDILFGGGPCEGPLMAIHTDPGHAQIDVLDGVCFSAEPTAAEWLIETEHRPRRFYVGCSGWAPGQLEGELATGSWITMPAKPTYIFQDEDDQPNAWVRIANDIADARLLDSLKQDHRPADPRLN